MTSTSSIPSTNIPTADEIVWGKQQTKTISTDSNFVDAQKSAWFGAFRSQLQEFSYEITDIDGSLPEDLYGSTLFRNGPSRFERGNQRVNHYLDGDGYISRISFANDGRIFFDSRFVNTEEYAREEERDRFLFRTTFGTQKPGGRWANTFETYLKNPANTHVVSWGNKLLALYEAGLPYQIDPETLATLGLLGSNGLPVEEVVPKSRWDAAIRLASGQVAVTAHPRIDPVRDLLVIWDWQVKAQPGRSSTLLINIREYDRNFRLKDSTHFAMPGSTVNPHDFALTPSYYVFFENRLAFDVLPFLLGTRSPADCLRLLKGCPTRVHLVPRPGGLQSNQSSMVFDTTEWFSIHQAFACDRSDGGVDVYSAGWPASGLDGGFLTSWGGYAPNFDAIAPTFLWQTTIHPQTRSVEQRVTPGVENYCIDHPCINPNYETSAARYLYMTYSNKVGESSPPVGYLRLDIQSGKKQIWVGELECFVEEPVFVPETGVAEEDAGWLLGIAYDHRQQRSSLLVLDAANVDRGPICRLRLTHHLVHGLHGSWCPSYYGP
ncbi:MAG: carotenoid oxygenase family protein [Synechococcus sp.]